MMDGIRWSRSYLSSWYESVRGWFDPRRGTWYLSQDGSILIPHVYRYGLNIDTMWHYRPDTRELVYGEDDKASEMYQIAWLSALLKDSHQSKEMDGFMGDLRISPKGRELPLLVFLQAWSIYDRHWWSADSSVRLEWIDRLAEEHSMERKEMESNTVPLVPCRRPTTGSDKN